MTDNTQELDEIVREFTRSAYQRPESTFLNAIYYQKFKEELLDWHNTQVEKVLDRLESKAEWLAYDDSEGEPIKAVDISAIEAERNKLEAEL